MPHNIVDVIGRRGRGLFCAGPTVLYTSVDEFPLMVRCPLSTAGFASSFETIPLVRTGKA